MTRPYFVQVLASGQWWDVARWQHFADAMGDACGFAISTEYVARVVALPDLIEWRSDRQWRSRPLAATA